MKTALPYLRLPASPKCKLLPQHGCWAHVMLGEIHAALCWSLAILPQPPAQHLVWPRGLPTAGAVWAALEGSVECIHTQRLLGWCGWVQVEEVVGNGGWGGLALGLHCCTFVAPTMEAFSPATPPLPMAVPPGQPLQASDCMAPTPHLAASLLSLTGAHTRTHHG
jgi:hypothetical protein